MTNRDAAEETRVLQGARFDVYQMNLTGSDGKLYRREVIRHPGAVVLLPVLDDGSVVMIENTRPTVKQTLLELPAGTREADEDPTLCAHRELIEETGFSAGKLELVHEFYSAPGISDELMSLYRATDLTAGTQELEATETIVTRIATRNQIRDWIADGTIRDAKTLVGLYAYLMA
jgi:ADP-ribose pyrophosphatase